MRNAAEPPRCHGWPSRPPPGRISYVDGAYIPHGRAQVHVEDRGLQFADSIYEVFGVARGSLADEEEHLDRLERSLREIGMKMPMERAPLKLVLREVVRRNRVEEGLVYLQVTRGATRRDHAVPAKPPRPTLILTARRVDPAVAIRRRKTGIAVITRPDQRWARRDIKSTALLPNILAKTAARDAGAFEAWLIDGEGYVTEGSSTSAWIVDADGNVVTRNLSQDILPGVTRRVMIEALAAGRIKVVERPFTPAEAKAGREAFITAATLGAMPVVRIDGAPVGDGRPGAVVRRVQELYEEETARRMQKKAG